MSAEPFLSPCTAAAAADIKALGALVRDVGSWAGAQEVGLSTSGFLDASPLAGAIVEASSGKAVQAAVPPPQPPCLLTSGAVAASRYRAISVSPPQKKKQQP